MNIIYRRLFIKTNIWPNVKAKARFCITYIKLWNSRCAKISSKQTEIFFKYKMDMQILAHSTISVAWQKKIRSVISLYLERSQLVHGYAFMVSSEISYFSPKHQMQDVTRD